MPMSMSFGTVRREVVESLWARLGNIAYDSTDNASKHSLDHERAISHWRTKLIFGGGGA